MFKFRCFLSLFFLIGVPLLEGQQQENSYLTLSAVPNEDGDQLVEVVDAFFRALREQDIPRAYFFHTSKEFRRNTSLSDFTRFIKYSSFLEKNKNMIPLQAHVDKQGGYYRGIATSTTGETRELFINFGQEEGDWKIRGIELVPLKQ